MSVLGVLPTFGAHVLSVWSTDTIKLKGTNDVIAIFHAGEEATELNQPIQGRRKCFVICPAKGHG